MNKKELFYKMRESLWLLTSRMEVILQGNRYNLENSLKELEEAKAVLELADNPKKRRFA